MREFIVLIFLILSNSTMAIVNGQMSSSEKLGVYKFTVLSDKGESGICSGAFINSNTFISAGHCLNSLNESDKKKIKLSNLGIFKIEAYHLPGSFIVSNKYSQFLGKKYYKTCSGRFYTKECLNLKRDFDIAYERTAQFDLGILKIKMPTSRKIKVLERSMIKSAIVEVSGFGYTGYNSQTGRCFKKTNLPTVRKLILKAKNRKHIGSTFYFQGKNYQDAISCPGDSGAIVTNNGKLIGILSGSYTQEGIPGSIMVPLERHRKFINRFL